MNYTRIRKVVAYLETKLTEEITLAAAADCGNDFCRVFMRLDDGRTNTIHMV